MTLNHDITTAQPNHRDDIRGDSTAGLTVIAVLLALILGFSAADLHRRAPDAGPVMSSQEGSAVLDGRGKWGGYMR